MRPSVRTPLSLLLLCALLLGAASAGTRAAAEDWMYDPRFREGEPGDVLHEGPPPLLRSQLDAYLDLLEASFDLAVPRDEELRLRDAVETAYGRDDRLHREAFAGLVAPIAVLRSQARRGDEDGVQEGVARFRRALDQRLAAEGGRPENRIVQEILARRQKAVWPGSPPIHGAAASAWLELAQFLASLARNEAADPTAGQRAQVEGELAAVLHPLPEALRRRLRDAHRVWLRTKATWDAADVDKRLALRWRAVQTLAEILPPERRIATGGSGSLQAYARAAQSLAGVEPAFHAWNNFAGNPELVLARLDEWLGKPDDRDDPLLYR